MARRLIVVYFSVWISPSPPRPERPSLKLPPRKFGEKKEKVITGTKLILRPKLEPKSLLTDLITC